MQHDGLEIHLEGMVATHKNPALMDNLALVGVSKPTLLVSQSDLLLPAGKLVLGETRLPFNLQLEPYTGLPLVLFSSVNVFWTSLSF